MKQSINLFKASLLFLSLITLNNAIAGQELKIFLETSEFFTLKNNTLETQTALISGKIKYKIKKFRIRRSGEKEITNSEESEGIRNIEILSDSEIKITLKETETEIIVPATVDRDRNGELISFEVLADDYLAALNPIHSEMDSKLFKMAKSKVLSVVPFDIKLNASNLICEVIGESETLDETHVKEVQCLQTHFIDFSR